MLEVYCYMNIDHALHFIAYLMNCRDYGQVWKFIRSLNLPYCKLYDLVRIRSCFNIFVYLSLHGNIIPLDFTSINLL